MWKALICLGLCVAGVYSQPNGQPGNGQQGPGGGQFNSPCLQAFDRSFRQCFLQNGNFQLEVIFSLVTNGSSGPLPQGTNRDQLVQSLCQNRPNIEACTKPIGQSNNMQCTQREKMMEESTIQSTGRAVAALCGVQPEMPPCLKKFDTKFKACMTQKNVNPENYFKLLANTTEGTGMNYEQLRKQTCSKTEQQTIVQCATNSLQSLNTECTKQEQFMVGQTLQNMMASYQSVCTGQPLIGPGRPASKCLQDFEAALEKCSETHMKVPTVDVMMLLTKGQVPEGQDMKQLNQTICTNFHDFEKCGKNAVKEAKCTGRDLLISEGTFANMIITIGAYCHDTTVPGACMLTLQQQFTKCFSQVGLDPDAYFSNQTAHKGALLGSTQQDATNYCNKRHDLYTCMKKVMHQCPGAEQTMTLTGFDLVSMERAVGVLCDDIPEYLAGLQCFAKPSDRARQCIDNMGRDITSMSAKQMAKGLSLNGFFQDFCKIRVEHVKCDAGAWETCDQKAVALKTKFECLLLPARCHDVNEDAIKQICPADAIVKPHTCLDDVSMQINSCLAPYNINSDMFIVNITHDRSSMLGSKSNAQNFCNQRTSIYNCLKKAIDSCPGASEMLAYWGHQQNLLEDALNVVCNNLEGYGQLTQCASQSSNSVGRCRSRSERRMAELVDKRPIAQISSAGYYSEFCDARMEQLKCDLEAVGSSCSKGVVGLKTEFECKLIQDRCQGMQRALYNNICNDNAYAKSDRNTFGGNGSGNTNNAGGNSGQSGNPRGGAGATSASVLLSVFSLLGSVLLFAL